MVSLLSPRSRCPLACVVSSLLLSHRPSCPLPQLFPRPRCFLALVVSSLQLSPRPCCLLAPVVPLSSLIRRQATRRWRRSLGSLLKTRQLSHTQPTQPRTIIHVVHFTAYPAHHNQPLADLVHHTYSIADPSPTIPTYERQLPILPTLWQPS